VAGEAELTIEAANQTQRAIVLVRPGPPYRLEGPDQVIGLNFGRGAVVDLRLRLYDRYGNQVWDSYPVNFYSLGGRFSPESPRAVDGEVTTQFSISPQEAERQQIWAMIPGTFAIYHAEAHVFSNHAYLPKVNRK
jgi:hypothetical protein